MFFCQVIKYIKKRAKALKNLSIVFASPGEVELVKSETEEIKDNEVLVEIAFSAISNGKSKIVRRNQCGDIGNSRSFHKKKRL